VATYYHLDPALVAALVDRETSGENVVGDKGNGFGLMQVDRKSHAFATCEDDTGRRLAMDPWMGVSYGCRLLRRLMDLYRNDSAAALAAYNAGQGRVSRALAVLRPDASQVERLLVLDAVTTGGDYASDVLRRRDAFA